MLGEYSTILQDSNTPFTSSKFIWIAIRIAPYRDSNPDICSRVNSLSGFLLMSIHFQRQIAIPIGCGKHTSKQPWDSYPYPSAQLTCEGIASFSWCVLNPVISSILLFLRFLNLFMHSRACVSLLCLLSSSSISLKILLGASFL